MTLAGKELRMYVKIFRKFINIRAVTVDNSTSAFEPYFGNGPSPELVLSKTMSATISRTSALPCLSACFIRKNH